MIAAEAMSYYPDFDKPFNIYTDTSEYQIGAAIEALYSFKFYNDGNDNDDNNNNSDNDKDNNKAY